MFDLILNLYYILISAHQASRSDGHLNVFPDYLVKWHGLPYSECTWEAGELISKRFKSSLEEYNLRNKSQCIPNKYCKVSVCFSYESKWMSFKACGSHKIYVNICLTYPGFQKGSYFKLKIGAKHNKNVFLM